MDRLTVLGTDGIVRYLSNGLQLEPCDLTPHDVRLILEKLCAYEDTDLEPEEIILFKRDYEKRTCTGCWLKDEKAMAKKINELKDLLELAAEELENLYERETELTERIREVV